MIVCWQNPYNFPIIRCNIPTIEEVVDYEVLRRDEELLLAVGFAQGQQLREYHWAASAPEPLLAEINQRGQQAYVTFVPPSFVATFKREGFQCYSHWMDYFHPDLSNVSEPEVKPDWLTDSGCGEASELTLSCRMQSRGFTGESAETFRHWLRGEGLNAPNVRNSAVLVYRRAGQLAGLVAVCIYGKIESPTLWVREIATRPEFQRQGIGEELLAQALWCGRSCGGKCAFLAADASNTGAIRLYERMGFRPKEADSGQLNLFWDVRGALNIFGDS